MARDEAAIWLVRGPRAKEHAAAQVAELRRAGWAPMSPLDGEPPGDGPREAGWVVGDLPAAELAIRFLEARAIVPRADVLVVVDAGDPSAQRSLDDLAARPGVVRLDVDPLPPPRPEERGQAWPGPTEVALPEPERAPLVSAHPAELARAANLASDQGWVVRIATWMRLRNRALAALGTPPEDPAWGEGAWVWWKADAEDAARELPDLVARAEAHGWPSLARLRLSLALTFLLRGENLLAAGHLQRARDALDACGLPDDAIQAHLALIIAHDRLGRSTAGMLEEAVARVGPGTSDVARARVEDSLGVALQRAGDIEGCLQHFADAVRLARGGGALRLALLFETRMIDVAHGSDGRRVEVDALRALQREVARRGGSRGYAVLIGLLGDRLRREGQRAEARRMYQALARQHAGAPAAVGLAQLAIDAGDLDEAAGWIEAAGRLQEVTGRLVRPLAQAISAPLHEHRQDLAAWERALDGWPLAIRGGHVDVADALERAAVMAASRGDQAGLARALRAGAIAHQHWLGVRRLDRADALLRRLRRWARPEVPVPLGPLDLAEEAGRGGGGTVWRAWHRELGTAVAVKVVTAGGPTHAAPSLDDEVWATARLRHPHVVGVRDMGVVSRATAAMTGLAEGSTWIALEWVAGGTLASRCGRLPWATCGWVLDQLLDALAHAHARGIVHRDVKPENVLWGGEEDHPEVRLGDFGLATAVEGRIAGTPAYMAPEQLRGRGIGPWSDLYALGCLAVALVQGEPPFRGSLREIREAHLRAAPPELAPRVAVPDGLHDWIARLLAKAPADRFASAAEARRALGSLGPPRSGALPAPRPLVGANGHTFDLEADLDELAVAELVRSPLEPVPPWAPARPELTGRPQGRAFAGRVDPELLGRDDALGSLWGALALAARGVAPRQVVVQGHAGVGVSALLAAFGVQARTAGCAHVLELSDGVAPALERLVASAPGPSAEERAGWLGRRIVATPPTSLAELGALVPPEEPILVLADRVGPEVAAALSALADDPRAWLIVRGERAPPAATPTESALFLDRLPLHQLVRVARDIAPLDPDDALRLAKAADGSPGAVTRLVRHALRDDQLTPTRRGLALREGAKLDAWAGTTEALPALEPSIARALELVDVLGHLATDARVRAAAAACGADLDGAPSFLELQAGRWRFRTPAYGWLLRRRPASRDVVGACIDVLDRADAGTCHGRVGLLVRAGRVLDALDELSALAWDYPVDVGDLDLDDATRAVAAALSASTLSADDPAWQQLSLVEARSALLAGDRARCVAALDRASAGPAPTARTIHQRVTFLRAVCGAHRDEAGAIAQLEAALADPIVADDPPVALRYRAALATFRGREDELAALAGVAADEPRIRGDLLRNLARRVATRDPRAAQALLVDAMAAYEVAGSPYGLVSALSLWAVLRREQGDAEGHLDSFRRAAELSERLPGTVLWMSWTNYAAALAQVGRRQEAAERVAAVLDTGTASLDRGSQVGAALGAYVAADGPSDTWAAARAAMEASCRGALTGASRWLLSAARARALAAGHPRRAAQVDAVTGPPAA